MKKITIGTLAHVDAGKTTLIESFLYLSKQIRKQGRVDHQDAFLDYDMQERDRGITIYSKEVSFPYLDSYFYLLDTPGHSDFSAEMERTLLTLDYAILVISGVDGIQSHTLTLWKLLEHYHVPTIIFINKMDISHQNKEDLIKELQMKFNEYCIEVNEESYETIAMLHEDALNEYITTSSLSLKTLQSAIQQRLLFPCFFGSALKNQGVNELLDALNLYTIEKPYSDTVKATVYKVSYENNDKLTHVKVLGGTLHTKDVLEEGEKIDQIRLYQGAKYEMINKASAGDVVVIKGLHKYIPGDIIGEKQHMHQVLMPYIQYRVVLEDGMDIFRALTSLKQLAQMDPTLHLYYNDQTKEITMQLMGEIQIEILQKMIEDRYHFHVNFDQGKITYQETIENIVEGVGHYEPLRHYAEVHLQLEPGERGSGISVECHLNQDELALHWQRLITTHIYEKEHLGVLTGSPITDLKITILGAKSHLKHTEPGDFREATYRAIRHGLKYANSQLLEPYYSFTLDVPSANMSKAIYDIEVMKGTFSIDSQDEHHVVLKGECPIVTMQNYQIEVTSYTKGQGQLLVAFIGYRPCHNQKEVVDSFDYDSETDQYNPTGSVFCSHGAGYYVPYNDVYDYMHIGPFIKEKKSTTKMQTLHSVSDKELDAIFERTYGPIKRKLAYELNQPLKKQEEQVSVSVKDECLLVDGYNIVFAWPELQSLAKVNLDAARERLLDLMSNYAGYRQCVCIVVFDAYKVKQNRGNIDRVHNLYVVYTKESQTADAYIERVTGHLSNDYRVTVATSDQAEQTIVLGRGAMRISALQLLKDYESLTENKMKEFQRKQPKSHDYAFEDLKEDKQ